MGSDRRSGEGRSSAEEELNRYRHQANAAKNAAKATTGALTGVLEAAAAGANAVNIFSGFSAKFAGSSAHAQHRGARHQDAWTQYQLQTGRISPETTGGFVPPEVSRGWGARPQQTDPRAAAQAGTGPALTDQASQLVMRLDGMFAEIKNDLSRPTAQDPATREAMLKAFKDKLEQSIGGGFRNQGLIELKTPVDLGNRTIPADKYAPSLLVSTVMGENAPEDVKKLVNEAFGKKAAAPAAGQTQAPTPPPPADRRAAAGRDSTGGDGGDTVGAAQGGEGRDTAPADAKVAAAPAPAARPAPAPAARPAPAPAAEAAQTQLNTASSVSLDDLKKLPLEKRQAVQYALEQAGLSSGPKNHKAFLAGGGPDKLEGIVGEKTTGGIDTLAQRRGISREQAIAILVSGDSKQIAALSAPAASQTHTADMGAANAPHVHTGVAAAAADTPALVVRREIVGAIDDTGRLGEIMRRLASEVMPGELFKATGDLMAASSLPSITGGLGLFASASLGQAPAVAAESGVKQLASSLEAPTTPARGEALQVEKLTIAAADFVPMELSAPRFDGVKVAALAGPSL